MSLQKLLGLGVAIAGVVTAAYAFRDEVDKIEHKGLTLLSGAALITLGGTLMSDIQIVENDWRGLFA